MKFDLAQFVQRGHHFAIVDEVDSILIDEARTPLIISGPAEESTDLYYEVDRIIPEAHAGRRDAGQRQGRGPRGARDDRRLPRRREAQDRAAHRDAAWPRPRRCSRTGSCRTRPGSTTRSNMPLLHHIHQGAARAHAVQARRRLHDQGRPGRHRRRVHRPPDAGPALERRAAPGRGSEGEGQDRAREPDARDHHLPELLPQVQEALRHDRHGRDRGRRVRQDLQARRHRRAAEPAARAQGRAGQRLPDRAREVRRDPQRHRREAGDRAGRRSSARSRSRSPRSCAGCSSGAASSTSS